MTGSADIRRDLGAANAFGSSGTIWLSFDWGQVSAGATYGGLTFFDGDGTERGLIGNTYGGETTWNMNGATPTAIPTVGMHIGVAKITLGAGATSTIELWVGLTGSTVNVSGAPMATTTNRDLDGVSILRIMGGSDQKFDNLLIGTTVADVDATDTPAPPTTYEAGLTFRLYDIQETMDQLYPLVPGQTPNVDQKRGTIDWSTIADFAGYTAQFLVECFATLDIATTMACTAPRRWTAASPSAPVSTR